MKERRRERPNRAFRRWTVRLGSFFGILVLVSALFAPTISAQEDLTGAGGSANAGQGAGDSSLVQPASQTPTTGDTSTPTATPTQSSNQSTSTSGSTGATNGDEGVGSGGDTGGGAGGTENAATPPSGDGSEIFESQTEAGGTDTTAAGEGTPTAPDDGAETADEPTPETLDVLVTVYDCETDPGANDPAGHADCVVVSGATVNAVVDQAIVASVETDDSGVAVLSLEDGLTVQIGQEPSSITSGYMATTSSKEMVVAEGAATFLVNVLNTSIGRFQVASGQCFTLGEPRTEMMVIGPMVQAASQACGPIGGVEFSLTGGALTEPMAIVTNGAGSWTGYLDPGAYTLSRNGTSVSFDVEAGAVSAVVSIDYVTGPSGTITVQRYVCNDGEPNGVTIEIYPGGGGGPPDASCVASSRNVDLYSINGGPAMVLDLQGGSITVDVAAGMGDQYVVRDTPSGVESAPYELAEGESVQFVITEIRVLGSITAQLFHCADPASNFEDPSHPGYWDSACGPAPAGITVTLRDGAGNVVSAGQTGIDGTVSFADLLPAVYTLTTTDQCAAFAGSVDVRTGFDVVPRESTNVALYSCAKPTLPPDNGGDNPPGGDVGSPAPPAGGNPTGGSLGGVPEELFSIGQFQPTLLPVPKPKLYVMNLPGVGVGTKVEQDHDGFLLPIVAIAAAAVGAFAMSRRLYRVSGRA